MKPIKPPYAPKTWVGRVGQKISTSYSRFLWNFLDTIMSEDDVSPKIKWGKPHFTYDPLKNPAHAGGLRKCRVTPEWVDSLTDNEVFVFGSNLLGAHDGGASFTAVTQFGAIEGQAEGRQGQSYAVPTDGVSLQDIQNSVRTFIMYAQNHQELFFLVTEIGCGTAGYSPHEIAPLFIEAQYLSNISLPESFWNVLKPVVY